jgi:hypothetical protein
MMSAAAPRWIDNEDTTTSSSRSQQHHGVEITVRDAEHCEEPPAIRPEHTTHPPTSFPSSSTAGDAEGGGEVGHAPTFLSRQPDAVLKHDDDDKHDDGGVQNEHLGGSRQYWRDIILGVNDGTFALVR